MKFIVRRFDRQPLFSSPEDQAMPWLAMLVAKDYERRMNGLRPDRWHWADEMLIEKGYFLQRTDGTLSIRDGA